MQAFLSELPHLESLSLDLTPCESHTGGPVASPVEAWLYEIVSHVASRVFSTLHIVRRRVDGEHLAAMNRDDALDMFFNERLRDILQGFPKLRSVNITVWDMHRRMGKFWTHIIPRRLASWPPGLRGTANFITMITTPSELRIPRCLCYANLDILTSLSVKSRQWKEGGTLGGIGVIPKHHPRPHPLGVVVIVHKDPEDAIVDPLATPIHVNRQKRTQNTSKVKLP